MLLELGSILWILPCTQSATLVAVCLAVVLSSGSPLLHHFNLFDIHFKGLRYPICDAGGAGAAADQVADGAQGLHSGPRTTYTNFVEDGPRPHSADV
ncbi:hypothetical protein QR685DRAFT_514410, partial [Neurospora intermedia]